MEMCLRISCNYNNLITGKATDTMLSLVIRPKEERDEGIVVDLLTTLRRL